MARLFDDAALDGLQNDTQVAVTAYPMTMAAWFNSDMRRRRYLRRLRHRHLCISVGNKPGLDSTYGQRLAGAMRMVVQG